MKTGTHKIAAMLALVVAGAALTAPPAAATDEARYGPADGWVAGVVNTGRPDNSNRTRDGSVPVDSREILSRTNVYGEPDGWTTRALEGSASVPADSRPVSFGAPDGWTTRALEGEGSLPADSKPIAFGAPDGWTSRAVTPAASQSDASSFDWGAAGLGAGGTLAMLLFVAVAAGIVREARTNPRGRLARS